MLTIKQEKFVQNLIQGMSQREAYKNSYDAKNMKDETIDKKASGLLKQEKIRGRYDELLGKIQDKAIMSAEKRMKWLTGVINGDVKDTVYHNVNGENIPIEKIADINTKIKALDTLNKMSGEYVTRIEGNISIEKLEDLL